MKLTITNDVHRVTKECSKTIELIHAVKRLTKLNHSLVPLTVVDTVFENQSDFLKQNVENQSYENCNII